MIHLPILCRSTFLSSVNSFRCVQSSIETFRNIAASEYSTKSSHEDKLKKVDKKPLNKNSKMQKIMIPNSELIKNKSRFRSEVLKIFKSDYYSKTGMELTRGRNIVKAWNAESETNKRMYIKEAESKLLSMSQQSSYTRMAKKLSKTDFILQRTKVEPSDYECDEAVPSEEKQSYLEKVEEIFNTRMCWHQHTEDMKVEKLRIEIEKEALKLYAFKNPKKKKVIDSWRELKESEKDFFRQQASKLVNLKIKLPKNAYSVFVGECYNHDLKNKFGRLEAFSTLAKQWENMSSEEKKIFGDKYQVILKERLDFMKKYDISQDSEVKTKRKVHKDWDKNFDEIMNEIDLSDGRVTPRKLKICAKSLYKEDFSRRANHEDLCDSANIEERGSGSFRMSKSQ